MKSIKIHDITKQKIDSIKIIPTESYDAVISRLVDENIKKKMRRILRLKKGESKNAKNKKLVH